MNFKDIDKSLLLKVRSGDLEAFDRMMTACENQIYAHLLSLSKNPDDAADLSQIVFLKIFKNRKNIDVDGNFRAWVYKIATNAAYDLFKKVSYIKEKFIIDDSNAWVETIPEDDSYYIVAGVNKLDIETTLDRLPPRQKTDNFTLLLRRILLPGNFRNTIYSN